MPGPERAEGGCQGTFWGWAEGTFFLYGWEGLADWDQARARATPRGALENSEPEDAERLLPCGQRTSPASERQAGRRRPGLEPETKRDEKAGLLQPEERSGRRGEGCAAAEGGGPRRGRRAGLGSRAVPEAARGRRCPAKPCRASCGH